MGSEAEICQKRATCRICGSSELVPVLDLGRQFIASLFTPDNLPETLNRPFPLELVRCADKDGCGLVQLGHSIAPRVLYHHYGYRSGINEKMQQNLAGIVRAAAAMVDLQAGDTVCDIGCNDGTLLSCFESPGLDRLGIDPAENVIVLARQKGIQVVADFFSQAVYESARPGLKAKIVATIAMFYDLEDPAGFVRDVASILAKDGVWVMELAYLPFILQNVAFDGICHEHLEYYSLYQLEWLLQQQGFQIHQIEFNDINGGSVRLFIRPAAAGDIPEQTRAELEAVRKQEQRLGLGAKAPYQAFYENALAVRRDLNNLLNRIQARQQTVYAYGASTKGNTILQFCGIDHRLIPKAADRNPEKWSCRTPATGIEIISEAQARAESPDYFLVLPWPFFDIFQKRESDFLNRGGRFILPLPQVTVVDKYSWTPA